MDFVSNREEQIKKMLQTIGVDRIEDLFSAVPSELLLKPPTQDDGLSEHEGMKLIERIGAKNLFPGFLNFLGAGAYEHHSPAFISGIAARSEFLTAYTPYQAEASQGTLQLLFEFQSAICALTELDVANSSLYDGASACAEGVMMALRVNKQRKKVLIAESVHPHVREVVQLYLHNLLQNQDVFLEVVPVDAHGAITEDALNAALDDDSALFVASTPSFFGGIDDIKSLFQLAASKGAMNILYGNPMSYGLYESPGQLGADIAVGDLQPFGIPLSFGGPYAGYIACRDKFMRQMPGKLVGETVDSKGRRAFTLALQTREQHIRREKATSNICTSQTLIVFMSLATMLWYGPEGLKELALTNMQRAAYLREGLLALPGVEPISQGAHFNEFSIKVPDVTTFMKKMKDKQIVPGLSLAPYSQAFSNGLLIAATETKSKDDLDAYIAAVKEVLNG